MQALATRAGRALAFVTTPGVELAGQSIRPYLPPDQGAALAWRELEAVLHAALGDRALHYERRWLEEAVLGASNLAGACDTLARLLVRRRGPSAAVYQTIHDYLAPVVAELATVAIADTLDLLPTLNVMDLSAHSPALQALLVRAALGWLTACEVATLVVLPTPAVFAPAGRAAWARDAVLDLVRAANTRGNYLLLEADDLRPLEREVRQAISVWIVGRQAGELAAVTRDLLPKGSRRPPLELVATLPPGEVYVCGRNRLQRVYVQPAWMRAPDARAIACGADRDLLATQAQQQAGTSATIERFLDFVNRGQRAQAAAIAAGALAQEDADVMSPQQEAKLDQVLEALKQVLAQMTAIAQAIGATPEPEARPRKVAGART